MENKICRINDEVFKELMEGVKHCVDKCDSRPILKYIQVLVKEKSVVFFALDGMRAGRAEREQENKDCFTCYIQPFPYKPLGGMPSDVLIEYDGKTAWVEFETVYGKLRYAFKQPDGSFPDMEKSTRTLGNCRIGRITETACILRKPARLLGGWTADNILWRLTRRGIKLPHLYFRRKVI